MGMVSLLPPCRSAKFLTKQKTCSTGETTKEWVAEARHKAYCQKLWSSPIQHVDTRSSFADVRAQHCLKPCRVHLGHLNQSCRLIVVWLKPKLSWALITRHLTTMCDATARADLMHLSTDCQKHVVLCDQRAGARTVAHRAAVRDHCKYKRCSFNSRYSFSSHTLDLMQTRYRHANLLRRTLKRTYK